MNQHYFTYLNSRISFYSNEQIEKEAVILLHGNSSNKDFFKPQLSSDLFEEFYLISPDFSGHGDSELIKSHDANSINGLALMVDAMVDYLELDRVVIYGVSLGGHVGIELISLLNSKMVGLMISGAPPLVKPIDFDLAFAGNSTVKLSMQENLSDKDVSKWLEETVHNKDVADVVKKSINNTNPQYRKLFGQYFGANMGFKDGKKLIESYDQNIAILQGEHERFASLEYLNSLSVKNLFENQIISIPDSSHYASLEQPELFNDILYSFAKKCYS